MDFSVTEQQEQEEQEESRILGVRILCVFSCSSSALLPKLANQFCFAFEKILLTSEPQFLSEA